MQAILRNSPDRANNIAPRKTVYPRACGYWAYDFIWLQLDYRWPGTTEITTQLRKNESSSIPWYGLLDSNQKLLFTSCDQDGKNAGVSGSGQSRTHFLKMLEDLASQMTEDRINTMLQELDR